MLWTRGAGTTAFGRATRATGVVLLVLSYALMTGGAALAWSDQVDREHGFVWSDPEPVTTRAYALVSDDIHLDTSGVQWVVDRVADQVRLEVTPTDPTDVLFVGVARASDVALYLRDVAYRQDGALGQGGTTWGWLGPGVTSDRAGGAPPSAPGDVGTWLAASSGLGVRTLTWPLVDGDWVIVIMNADAHPGVSVTVRTGAAAPHLRSVALGMVLSGVLLLAAGARLVRARRAPLPELPTRGPGVRTLAGRGDEQASGGVSEELLPL